MRTKGLALGFFALAAIVRAQAPAVNAGGVVNSGSYTSGGVAPGSIVAIFGTNLASTGANADTIPISTGLGDVTSVTFNNVPAPLLYVTQTQIGAQMPWNALSAGETSGSVNIVVNRSTGASAPQSVSVIPASPGIFTATANGLGQGIATDNTDGAIAAPAGSIAGLTTHPISLSSGHPLIVWCTGLGAVTPGIDNGVPGSGSNFSKTNLTPTVMIGNVPATFVYSVLSPQFVSLYQIGVVPAASTPTGDAVPLQIQINGVTTSDKVTIAVAP